MLIISLSLKTEADALWRNLELDMEGYLCCLDLPIRPLVISLAIMDGVFASAAGAFLLAASEVAAVFDFTDALRRGIVFSPIYIA